MEFKNPSGCGFAGRKNERYCPICNKLVTIDYKGILEKHYSNSRKKSICIWSGKDWKLANSGGR